MKFLLSIAFMLPFIASSLAAQTVSDAALEECQAQHETFTRVKECLPETDVAIAMIKHTVSDEYFGLAGSSIARACAELNDDSNGTWVCTRSAISDAVELLAMVGDPTKIEDLRFQGVADSEILSRLLAQEDVEQGRFDQMMWGGSLYQPLR